MRLRYRLRPAKKGRRRQVHSTDWQLTVLMRDAESQLYGLFWTENRFWFFAPMALWAIDLWLFGLKNSAMRAEPRSTTSVQTGLVDLAWSARFLIVWLGHTHIHKLRLVIKTWWARAVVCVSAICNHLMLYCLVNFKQGTGSSGQRFRPVGSGHGSMWQTRCLTGF